MQRRHRGMLPGLITVLLALAMAAPAQAVIDPVGELSRAQGKIDETIVQLEDTIAQLEEAIAQLELAAALDDLCAGCEAQADAEVQRAEAKLAETNDQLEQTRLQLRVARGVLDDVIVQLDSGTPIDPLLPQLDQVRNLLNRARAKLDRAGAKLAEVDQQLANAELLYAACGACADQAAAEVQRAHGLVSRGITKIERAITKVQGAIDQISAVMSRVTCPADTDGDGVVNVDDLVNVIVDWGTATQPNNGDVNNDGVVNIDDLVAVIVGWGDCPPGQPVDPVVVEAFNPSGGVHNDTIQIFGSGFERNPDNNCAVVMMTPTCSMPLHVIGASPDGTLLTARVGPVFKGAMPGPVMVGRGIGVRDFFEPQLPAGVDPVIVEVPVWVWQRQPLNAPAGMSVRPFNPVPPPPPNPWLHGEPTPEGTICLFLPPTAVWQPNQKVEISLHMHNHDLGIGIDAHLPCLIFEGPNVDPFDCAIRICDSIRCAIEQLAGVDVNCFVDITPMGIKITLIMKGPDGQSIPIHWGALDVCLIAPPAPVIIAGTVGPPALGTGDTVDIIGSGFGNNPDNICAIIMNGDRAIPMRAEEVFETVPGEQVLRARVGPMPPDAVPGPIMVARGLGGQGTFVPAFDDIVVVEPVWIWDRYPVGGPEGGSPTPVTPAPPPVPLWLHGGIENGMLCLFIPPDVVWEPDQKLSLVVRAHNHASGIGHDGDFPCMQILGDPGSPRACAERICDMIRCAFFQQSGHMINCFVENLPGGTVKITIGLKGSNGQPIPIDWGNFDLCLTGPPGEPCVGDVNGDGVVNEQDAQIVQNSFGPCPPPPNPCPGDVNGDGVVDPQDLEIVLSNFGPCP